MDQFNTMSEIKKFTLGININSLYIKPSNFNSLESITCNGAVPPNIYSFTTKQYLDVQVKVPKGSLSAYQNASPWKYFWSIEEFEEPSEENGIEGIFDEEDENVMIFSINGILLRSNAMVEELSNLPKGQYIIKKGDKTVKIVK